MMKLISTMFIFVCVAVSVAAQVPFEKAVNEYVSASIERQKVPGFAVGVYKGGKPYFLKGYGYANLEHNVPVTPDTVFQLASVGKQFTSAGILLLEQDGKISVDDKVSKYIEDTPESWNNMTIRHLLSHTSGLGDYPRFFNYRKDYSEKALLKIIKKQKLQFEPGSKFRYSNFGYVTLGIIIRKVSGKYYGDFLTERLFKPLQMKTARVISESEIIPNRAAGYTLQRSGLKNQNWVAPTLNTTADGALYMTLKDMQKWDAALRDGKIVSKASLKKAWTPTKLIDGNESKYGFGWTLSKVTGSEVVEHSGSWQGFKSHIARYVDRDTTIVVFANASQANTREMILDIAEIIDPALARIREKPIGDSNPELTSVAEQILKGRIEGKVPRELFAKEKGKQAFDIMNRYYDWMGVYGALKKSELVEELKEGDSIKRKYRFYFEDAENVILFIYDKDGKVTGFAFL